ncbi:MAG: hypothetical protein JNM29_07820 [Candidatus Odyssella sp.]|nr:hypothetical protein [Candidatus Odyssella sp.]
MLRFAYVAAAAALAAGCAQINPETPAGASYAINCPSGQLELCFAKAKELCPQGYDVVQLRRNQDSIMMAVAPDRLAVKCRGQ